MKKFVTLFFVLVFVVFFVTAADPIRMNVTMSAAYPGGQYVTGVIPSIDTGEKLNLKYTLTLKEDVSIGSIFEDVKSFFSVNTNVDNYYICALVNFNGVEDVSLVSKSNGAYVEYEEPYYHMILCSTFYQNIIYFRGYLALLKGINLDTWGNDIGPYYIDALDNVVAYKGSIDRDNGMRYSLSLLDFVSKKDIIDFYGEEYVNYAVNGKHYIIMMPYKKNSPIEIEFQLDSKNVVSDTLDVELSFFYLTSYDSSSLINANIWGEDCYVLEDSTYFHAINVNY